jgi:hypothetical protein
MAGGMSTGPTGIPLSQRTRTSPAGGRPQPADADVDVGADVVECPARHCWVTGTVDQTGVKRPGLLVEWRTTESGWEGRVLYPATLRPGQWQLIEEWLPATLLLPPD